MGYAQRGSWAELFNPAWIDAAAEEATLAVGVRFLELVKARTPVAKNLGGLSDEEMAALRGGRKPGTLRDGWYLTPGLKAMGAWTVSVANDDPVAIYVEFDTRPHMIYPRQAQALAWPTEGGMAFAASVHHPGTKGQHPLQLGALMTEAEFPAIAGPIFEAAMLGEMAMAAL